MSETSVLKVVIFVAITTVSATNNTNSSNSTTTPLIQVTTDVDGSSITQGTTGTTTPPPTTVPTTPDPCLSAVKPTDEYISLCNNETCAQKILEAMELIYRCEEEQSETGPNHPTEMAVLGEMLAMKVARNIKTKLDYSLPVNTSVVIVTDQLAMGSTVINGTMFTNTSVGNFYFPDVSQEGVGSMLGGKVRNSISYPKKHLPPRSGLVQVGWSILEVSSTEVPKSEIEPFRDIVWRLPISEMKIEKNKILIAKEKPNLVINSRLITFSLDPKLQGPLADPLKIAFQRSKNTGVKNHMCYYWAKTSPSIGHWSSIGCAVVSNNDTHTICSYNHMSIFAVLSEVHHEKDDDSEKAVRIVAIVLCILAMAALIGTIYISRKLLCLDNDRVNIHVNLCMILLIGYFLFIVGVVKSDIKVLNDVLSFSLHFCQLSPLVWLCLEAVYLFNTIHPIFNYENTNPRKLYTSMGWAMTAAFAGASAGYDLPHHGKPFASEIVWIFIDKVSVWYFLGPFILLFVVNVFLRAVTMIELIKYTPASDDDKAPQRIKVNIFTSLVLAAIVFLAWYFGIQAVNNSETKGYHYGFIVLYSFQAFLVFIIYGWQNEEMWSLHSKRKEEARKIEERKVTFTYVP